ncbi:hypothetical protein E1B28_001259 [Marasmius oreades]|uniref:Protein kinase domain-containing protein n=1 Tax=Marasmius oreades TaxID=181124 RepID=A0A9P7V341_9AGAR|nr:uncharacterized protein E1B28_001259 [Marasmius oreades]KAG7099406.1 hypothetical protein E1B28_001259 [Marasmius oreades]
MNSRTVDITQFETRNLRRDTNFFQQLVASPETLISLAPALTNDSPENLCRHGSSLLEQNHNSKDFCATTMEGNTLCPSTSMTAQSLYPPSKRWDWINDHQIIDIEQVFLSDGAICDVYLTTANIGDRQIKYICKTWRILQNWDGALYSELALYKKHMKNLQGNTVPSIITVLTGPTTLSVAMEPPHNSFWIEASIDMPLILKDRCVEAFQKLHECGVLHGDVELRHMLIGGDGKVTIIDFQESRALEAIEAVHLKPATPAELRREMRKVKVKLDYPGCRDLEYGRLQRYHRRLQSYNGERQEEVEEGDDREDDLQNPPITDIREWEDWVKTPSLPRRFVIPGQTPARVFEAVQHFLGIVDPLEPRRHDMQAHELTLKRNSSSKRSIENEESSELASPPKRVRYHEPGLLSSGADDHPSCINGVENSRSRKRTVLDEFGDAGPRRKRIRLDGYSDLLRHRSAFNSNAPDIPRSSFPPPQVYIPDHATTQLSTHFNVLERQPKRSSPTSDVISMHNLALCAVEKLPHPTLVQLFPNHPRWQEPDVRLYLNERLLKRQELTGKARAFPNKIFFSPGAAQSRGNLRRALTDIRKRIGYPATIPVVESLSDADADTESDTSTFCGARVRFSCGDLIRESGTLNDHDKTIHISRPQSRTDILRWHRHPVFGWLREFLNLW